VRRHARSARDFPVLVQAYLEGRVMMDELITQRIRLDAINRGFSALRDGKTIRSVVTFG
jgi:S-(hydroxymethyl)glutathione dehydrogenase / alcohol dehydrogenase